MKDNSILLCCTPLNPCPECPNLIYNKDYFLIEDDYDDSIKIHTKDIEQLVQDVDSLLKQSGFSLDNKR